MVWWNCT